MLLAALLRPPDFTTSSDACAEALRAPAKTPSATMALTISFMDKRSLDCRTGDTSMSSGDTRGCRRDETLLSDAFFFQAEDGIRDLTVTGVQTCALPILEAGVAPESIENPRLCTACHPDLLYSYRRGNRGRLVTVAAVP